MNGYMPTGGNTSVHGGNLGAFTPLDNWNPQTAMSPIAMTPGPGM